MNYLQVVQVFVRTFVVHVFVRGTLDGIGENTENR